MAKSCVSKTSKENCNKRRGDVTNDVRVNGGGGATKSNVFRLVELHEDDRRRRVTEAQKANNVEVVARSRKQHRGSDDDDYESDDEVVENDSKVEEKKPKVKKTKKPKVSVQEVTYKIDASVLASFLVDVTASYEAQQYIQLMQFANYFARALSNVVASQFPWKKTFKESPLQR